MTAAEREIVHRLEGGLGLTPKPFAEIARALDTTEEDVIDRVRALQASGVIKRLGVVVRHRALGIRENAMVVWDVPDAEVDAVGAWLGEQDGVNLCYRRPRRPPHWPYNLYCMIHGRARDEVRGRIDALRAHPGLEHAPYAVLFSSRCFKQRGARYSAGTDPGGAGDGPR